MVSVLYLLFSTISLVPLYSFVKKLTASEFIYNRFSAILLATVFMCFHLYIFHAEEIPILRISIKDNEFIYNSSFIFSLLCATICAITHNRS